MNTQPEHKAIATWMESLGFKIRHTDMYEHDDLSRLFNEEEAAFFYNAHLAAVAEARREAEQRGADNIILELVSGWSGLSEDIRTIKQGAGSLQRKASALATRLSALNHKKRAPHE